jgi:hypothetical protein
MEMLVDRGYKGSSVIYRAREVCFGSEKTSPLYLGFYRKGKRTVVHF